MTIEFGPAPIQPSGESYNDLKKKEEEAQKNKNASEPEKPKESVEEKIKRLNEEGKMYG